MSAWVAREVWDGWSSVQKALCPVTLAVGSEVDQGDKQVADLGWCGRRCLLGRIGARRACRAGSAVPGGSPGRAVMIRVGGAALAGTGVAAERRRTPPRRPAGRR